jgi:predicted CopG family antitoxin
VETKTIKISTDIYESLRFCKNAKTGITMDSVVFDLVRGYETCKNEIVREEEEFVLIVDGRKKKLPSFSSPNKIIRISKNLHSWLKLLKSHPDESFNTLLFKMISCHYENKPIYRIFGNGCGNCEMLNGVVEELMQDPLFNKNIVVEHHLNRACYSHLWRSHSVDGSIMLPVAIMFDHNGEVCNLSTGYQQASDVRELFEKVISPIPEETQALENEIKPKSKKQKRECTDGCEIKVVP